MARKKVETKDMATATQAEPTLKAVRVEFEPDMHILLRTVAASEGLSMSAFVKTTIEKLVRDEAKRKGIK